MTEPDIQSTNPKFSQKKRKFLRFVTITPQWLPENFTKAPCPRTLLSKNWVLNFMKQARISTNTSSDSFKTLL